MNLEPLPISDCPKCRDSASVKNKLVMTNLRYARFYREDFEVTWEDRQLWDLSKHTNARYINGLYCSGCDLAFIPMGPKRLKARPPASPTSPPAP